MDAIIFYPMRMKHEAADATLAVCLCQCPIKIQIYGWARSNNNAIYETLSFVLLIHLQLETVQIRELLIQQLFDIVSVSSHTV